MQLTEVKYKLGQQLHKASTFKARALTVKEWNPKSGNGHAREEPDETEENEALNFVYFLLVQAFCTSTVGQFCTFHPCNGLVKVFFSQLSRKT